MKLSLSTSAIATIAIFAAMSPHIPALADTAAPASSGAAHAAPPDLPTVGPPGVAATVDGFNIMESDLENGAYEHEGDKAFTELENNILIDDEAKKENADIPQGEIDAWLGPIRNRYKPTPVEQIAKVHGTTMQEMIDGYRRNLLLDYMAGAGTQKPLMTHVRKIVIFAPPATEADAKAKLAKILAEYKAGKHFDDLAQQYSDDPSKANGGDVGVIYEGAQIWHPVHADEIKAALALKTGEVTTSPVQDASGWAILQAVSTIRDHPDAEEPLYDAALHKWQEGVGIQNASDFLQNLRTTGKLVDYRDKSPDGQDGIAAEVNGKQLTMADVRAHALELARSEYLNRLIDMRLASEEAQKDNIVVTDRDVDYVKSMLSAQIAPDTLEDNVKNQHMTMQTFDEGIRFKITLYRLAGKDIAAPPMYHLRRILIPAPAAAAAAATTTANPYQSAAAADPATAEVISSLEQDAAQIQAGKSSFEDMAKQVSQDKTTKDKGGDMGLVYDGLNPPVDPAIMDAVKTLKPGDITLSPVQSADGYNLVQLVSSSDNHPASENQDYIDAAWHYKELQGSHVAGTYMQSLHKAAKIVVYAAP